MATERLLMRHIREILRLKWTLRRSHRDTARSLGISAGAVASVVSRAKAIALTWDTVGALSDDALERTLYGPKLALTVARPEPDLVWMHTELRRPGVTLELLHLEYLAAHPDGYRYSAFCGHYRRWLAQQRTYADWARHYGTAIVPARPAKPRDKAKVEVAVQVAERWILARLRNETFFTLAALNARITELLTDLNDRPMKGYGGASRRALFERFDRPALQPLPRDRYVHADWRHARVHIGYPVEVGRHYSSAPHPLINTAVEVPVTATTVDILPRGARVW